MAYRSRSKCLATHISCLLARWSHAFFVGILAIACLSACDSQDEGVASSISGYNYTIEGIQEFHVNGAWGGNLGIGAGYDKVCCIALPKKWTPGLSATVEWRRTECQGDRVNRCPRGSGVWHYKTLKETIPIEPYDHSGSLQVMFLPNDEIKILVSMLDPDHPDHPLKLGRPHPIDHPEWTPYQP